MRILLKAPIADLYEAEYPFDDAEDVFNPATNVGLETILGPLDLVYDALVPITAVREVAGLRRLRSDQRLLTLVGRVAPHSGLVAMKEIGQDRGVMDVGSRRDYGVDHLGFAIDPDMGFHAKKPLVTFLGLVHVGVAFPLFVLCR